MGQPRIVVEAARRERESWRAIGAEVRRLREDAGITQSAMARHAFVDQGEISRVEAGHGGISIASLERIALALGADLGVHLFPNTGPRIRDRYQAAMLQALASMVHRRWLTTPEVVVHRPARGSIDMVLHDPDIRVAIATEAESGLRRVEQQIRWGKSKAESIESSTLWRTAMAHDPPEVSRLLVVRSTRATREVAAAYPDLLRGAYPASCADAFAALTTPDGLWPGPAILWATVEVGVARILSEPPRGVRLGRRT
jgi:transcriptional regulator with XRE-family HTH domain